MANTTKGFPYPAGSDAVDVAGDIQALAEAVDETPGVQSYTSTEIAGLAVGAKWAGRVVWNSTAGKLQVSNGSTFSDVDTSVALSSSTPQTLGTAAAGTSSDASRADHRHAMPSASDVGAIGISLVGAANGVAGLDANATLTVSSTGSNDLVTASRNAASDAPSIVVNNPNGGASAGGRLSFKDNGTERAALIYVKGAGTTPSLRMTTAGTERFRINSVGVVFVGNGATEASPALGDIRATAGTGTDIGGGELRLSGGAGTGAGAGGPVSIYTSAAGASGTTTRTLTERLRVDSTGVISGTGSLGAWTAYTPTLAGTSWNWQTSTASGRYCQIGKIVHFRVLITFAGGVTVGADVGTFTLPVTASTSGFTSVGHPIGTTTLRDASLDARHLGLTIVSTSTVGAFGYLGTNSALTLITSSAPFTWANDDQIIITGTYEAA